jgi:Bacterial membrane protein YfhO
MMAAMAFDSRSRGRAPLIPRIGEVAVVALLFTLLVGALFPEVVSGRRTLAPNGLLNTQSGRARVEYPYPPPARSVMSDGGAFVWLFEPLAQVVHHAYSDGEIPLWNPYGATGQPLAANFQSAALSPVYAPVFAKPTQRMWDLVLLARLVIGAVGCFALLRALGARAGPALVASTGYLLSPVFVLWIGYVSISVEMLAPWLLLAILALADRRTPLRFAALAVTCALAVLGGQPETLLLLGVLGAAWAAYVCVIAKASWRGAVGIGLAALCGALLAGPMLWLGLEYASVAQAAHVVPEFNRARLLDELKLLLVGDFAAREHAALGMVMLVLAVAGVAQPRANGVLGVWFMVGAIVVWLAWALHLPGHQLFDSLPGTENVKVLGKGDFLLPLAGGVLAANGVESALRGSRRAALAGTAAALLPLALVPTGGAIEGNARGALLVGLLTAATVWAVAVRRWLLPGIAVVLVVQFFLLTPRDYARPYDMFMPQRFVEYVQEALRPGERMIGIRSVMHPNYPAALSIDDPRTMDGLYPERYEHYLRVLLGARTGDNFGGEIKAEHAGSPFLDALAVRFVAARLPTRLPRPHFTPVFVDRKARIRVWENTRASPRAFIPASVTTVAGEREAARALLRGPRDLEAESVVENATPGMRTATGRGTAVVEHVGWSSSRFRTRANAPSVLVVSEQYYPGWHATVDGRETPIRPANIMMRAVSVPAGEHLVEFHYRPSGFSYGVWMSVAGALVLVTCLVLAGWSRARRRVAAVPPAHPGA